MKFLVTKDLHHNPLLKSLVLIVIIIGMFFLISDILLHHLQIGLNISDASEVILGNEDAFVDPLPFDTLLERVHINILTSMMTLMIISIVCISVATTNRFKGVLIHIAFISAIVSHASLLLSFYYGSLFIIIWIIMFVLWHTLALLMSLSIIWRLLSPNTIK